MPGTIFEEQDDAVIARLSVDVPDSSVASLRGLAQSIESLKAGMEYTSRFTEDASQRILELAKGQDDFNKSLSESLDKLQELGKATDELASKKVSPEVEVKKTETHHHATTGDAGAGSASGASPQAPTPLELHRRLEALEEAKRAQTQQIQQVPTQQIPVQPQASPSLPTQQVMKPVETVTQTSSAHSVPKSPQQEAESAGKPGADAEHPDVPKSPQQVSEEADKAQKIGLQELYSQLEQRGRAAKIDGVDSFRKSRFDAWEPIDEAHAKDAEGLVDSLKKREKGGTLGRLEALKSDVQGVANIASQETATGALGATEGFLGGLASGGVGGVASLATKAIPVVGGITTALEIANTVKDQYVKYDELGREAGQGGGFKEGVEIEGQARMMAINPFISTEQSRQIIMSAMQAGYSGEQYDNAIDFMKTNFEDLGISVSDSMKMLKKNVDEGGQSVVQLGSDLAAIKESSKTSGVSQQAMTQDYEKTSGALTDQGVSGSSAGEAARLGQESLSGSGVPVSIQGQGNQLISGMMQNQAVSRQIAKEVSPDGYTPLTPEGVAQEAYSNPEETVQKSYDYIYNEIHTKFLPDTPRNRERFYIEMKAKFPSVGWDVNQWSDLYTQLLPEGSADKITGNAKSRVKATKKAKEKGVGGYLWDGVTKTADMGFTVGTGGARFLWTVGSDAWDGKSWDETKGDLKGKAKKDVKKLRNDYIEGNNYYSVPGLDKLMEENKDLRYVRSDGKDVRLTSSGLNKMSQKEIQDLVDKGQWRTGAGQEAVSFDDLINDTNGTGGKSAFDSGGKTTKKGAVPETNTNVSIAWADPEMAKIFKVSSDTSAAYRGDDGKTVNNVKSK